ncbi:D-alanyl-D-alanine carboxypeptidase-like protein [Solirubrobacter pauli]|uniref:D-alanyl-D-alanine carboxypeptidase-like protein n=1 Tax=Solirubrobacter pauli TaxID=166793 RepID=A0A660LGC3_9ACTN|nr:M15 family metallopeptidase [Solirubrobacter pauli]RKQ91974.1 D-alanyl-D-alanine carboxypeptidase-like protein [Solirubrobacter pauli]
MKYLCLLALAACLIPILGGDSTAAAPVALDPQLERAVQAATRDAARDGITIQITSGVRTRAHQQQLLDEAIETYGSEAVARQYVNTPERSTHVQGLAVDVGPTDAAYWLAQHGAAYGLCQIYANEIWHYERVVEPGGACPPQRPNAAG